MSTPTTAPPAADPGPAQQQAQQENPEESEPGPDQTPPGAPQNTWDAAQELLDHAPGIFTGHANLFAGGSPSFAGHLISGDQRLVTGGMVDGDVIGGHKTVFNIGAAFGGPLHDSGEISPKELDRLAEVFHPGPGFDAALRDLRTTRVLVLKGSQGSGRRSAGLMLLHLAGAGRIRSLNPDVPPSGLLRGVEPSGGYLMCDFNTPRSKPLHEHHLLRLREQLAEHGRYLVITAEESAALYDVPARTWTAPAPDAVLAAHLRARLRGTAAGMSEADLLRLEPVTAFLAVARPVREVADFAAQLSDFAYGRAELEALENFGPTAVREQISRWFDRPEVSLRDKAFLLSLAVFDQAPYALTAELSDRLHQKLYTVETALPRVGVPPFGPSIESRLQLARAIEYQENEQTPWGPVPQRMASYTDRDTAHVLLRETWGCHPSARPALVEWIHDLAADRRPLVRTRAASTTALLASVDLPSVVSRLLGPWSESKDLRLCLQAANTLMLAYVAGTTVVPRILHDWCQDDLPQRRWTAIRAYALLGPLMPEETFQALALLARRISLQDFADLADPAMPAETPVPDGSAEPSGKQQSVPEADALVEATELLLLSGVGATALRRLVDWLEGGAALRHLALSAFLAAARRTEGGEEDPLSWPLLLRRYAFDPATTDGTPSVTSVPGPADQGERALLSTLWRAALTDRAFGSAALRVLQSWVEAAEDGEVEAGLSGLLGELAVTERDRLRLDHLLRTAQGQDGSPPAFTTRLRRLVASR